MPCLAFPPRAHHRCSQYPHEASKQRLYRYLMCCAPRLRAALTPQPAARVTDVRTCFKSEDENQQGNQNDGILSYHFTPQMPELENIFFSSTNEHVFSAPCNGWYSCLSPVALKELSAECRNSQSLQ